MTVGADPHPALAAAEDAARRSFDGAVARWSRDELVEAVATGADGTPTSRLDQIVEDAVVAAVAPFGVNILSEEMGFDDRGSSVTLVIDPVDGTGNAASGVPVAAFTGAVAIDGVFLEGMTSWFQADERWWARRGVDHDYRSSGRTVLERAVVSTIRPKGEGLGWLRLARGCDRIRILGSSSIEAALVVSGRLDAFVDTGSDTHRIVDLAAAIVLAEGSGAVVRDMQGRPFELDPDVGRRWSGIVAATPELADRIVETVNGLDAEALTA